MRIVHVVLKGELGDTFLGGSPTTSEIIGVFPEEHLDSAVDFAIHQPTCCDEPWVEEKAQTEWRTSIDYVEIQTWTVADYFEPSAQLTAEPRQIND